MIDEIALQQLMVTTFEDLKIQYATLSTLIAEVAALRETLRETGGQQFSSLFEKHQLEQRAKTASIESAQAHMYDEIIRRVKGRKAF
jgi:hypothetical protein